MKFAELKSMINRHRWISFDCEIELQFDEITISSTDTYFHDESRIIPVYRVTVGIRDGELMEYMIDDDELYQFNTIINRIGIYAATAECMTAWHEYE